MSIERFLKESKVYKAVQKGRDIEEHISSSLKKLQLNFDQAVVLVAVFRNAKLLRPNDLSTLLGWNKSRLSQILSHLESMQFLRRVVDPNDARSYLLKPRPERRADIAKVMNTIEKAEQAF